MQRATFLVLACCACHADRGPASKAGPVSEVAPEATRPPIATPPPPTTAIAAPRPGSTRIVVEPADAPGFAAPRHVVVDVEPPFQARAELDGKGTPAATIAVPGDARFPPIRIFRPALITSADEALRGAQRAKAAARREGDCVIIDGGAAWSSVDCYSASPGGPVACAWQGPQEPLAAAIRTCQSVGFE